MLGKERLEKSEGSKQGPCPICDLLWFHLLSGLSEAGSDLGVSLLGEQPQKAKLRVM